MKSILFGVGTAALAVVVWIAASVWVNIAAGVGAITVAIDIVQLAVAAAIGFVAGFLLHRSFVTRRRN